MVCENFILKKITFKNGPWRKCRNASPKMVRHRHKRGPREGSSTPTRYVLAGRDLGAHRKPFLPSSESLFFVCGLLLYLVANGRKWSQMVTNGRKRYQTNSFALFPGTYTHHWYLFAHTFVSYETQVQKWSAVDTKEVQGK